MIALVIYNRLSNLYNKNPYYKLRFDSTLY